MVIFRFGFIVADTFIFGPIYSN